MREFAEGNLHYACSLALPSDDSEHFACCDADWELLKTPDILFVAFCGDAPLVWGCSELSFAEVAHGEDVENSAVLWERCSSHAEKNLLVDVFVARRDSAAYGRFLEYLSSAC